MLKNRIVILLLIALGTSLAGALEVSGNGIYIKALENSGVVSGTSGIVIRSVMGYPVGSPVAGSGYNLDLGLRWLLGTGEGWTPWTEVVTLKEGPVILEIERVADSPGSPIRVRWSINTEKFPQYAASNVDIYCAVHSGPGYYHETIGFDKLISNSTTITSPPPQYLVGQVTVTPSQKYFEIANQVGAGNAEIYFKGLIAGSNSGATGDFGLRGAIAVGKVNASLEGTTSVRGKNLIAIPFLPIGDRVGEVFGEGDNAPWQEGDEIQYKLSGAPAYLSAVYTSAKAWKDGANTANDPQFTIDPKKGNWILIKAPMKISLVGKVINIPQDVEIFGGGGLLTGGKTLLGLAHPSHLELRATSLIADGASEGDTIQYKISPLNQAYISAVVVGGQWKNAANANLSLDPRIADLTMPNSYIYVRYGTDGITWKKAVPWQ